MSASSPTQSTPGTEGVERIPVHEVDASLRWPLLSLFTHAAFWLVAGTVLAWLSAIQLHKGEFLADCPWLTVGRIRPASSVALIYGFASQAGLGVLLWLLCRLGNVRFPYAVAGTLGSLVWNLGVLVGTVGILAGGSTGFAFLEMPRAAAGILFAAYVVLGLCAVGTFQVRRVRELYPTQWFLFAALFWFPWLLTAGYFLLVLDPVRGVYQSVVAAWFAGGIQHLWLGLIGLGTIYYFYPKLAGRPLFSSQLAGFAFWVLLIFGSWAGVAGLQGSPVPAWLSSAGVAATLCLLAPLAANVWNWTSTQCPMELFRKGGEVRFMVLAVVAYAVAGVAELALACPVIDRRTGLTLASAGVKGLFLHGFVGSALLGAIYYILPRVLQVRWPKENWVGVHFALQAAGAFLIFVGLGLGGFVQGGRMADVKVPFLTIAQGAAPFLGISTLGLLLLLAGQALWLLNLVQLVRGYVEPAARGLCAELCGCGTTAKAGVKS